MSSNSYWDLATQFTLIYVLIILVVGAILFWIVHKFVWNLRLATLLRILVVLLCLAAILRQVLLLFGVGA
ncbi:MAG: hypothetical protein ABSE67_17530 [Xanthobacteraceae bacterium]|jgi:hypothetical protein